MTKRGKIAAVLSILLIIAPLVHAWFFLSRRAAQLSHVAALRAEHPIPDEPFSKWMPYNLKYMGGGSLTPAEYDKLLNSGLSQEIIRRYYWRAVGPVKLDFTIRYYESPQLFAPVVCEIPAGTFCHIGSSGFSQSFYMSPGKGPITFPTKDPHWRYGSVLDSDGNDEGNQYRERQMGYVRTEDIRRFWELCNRENPGLEQYVMQSSALNNTRWGKIPDPLLTADYALYQRGIYASPNLCPAPWNLWCSVSMMAAAGCMVYLAQEKRKPR